MTVTFSVVGAPKEVVSEWCLCTQLAPLDIPLDQRKTYADIACFRCGGTGVDEFSMSLWPELNLTNTNARSLLRLLGLPAENDLFGELSPSEIPPILQKAIRLANSKKARNLEVYEPCWVGDYYTGGLSDKQIARYAAKFLEVGKCAIENNSAIQWG